MIVEKIDRNTQSSGEPGPFDCPVCLDLFHEPFTLICNHTFCSRCIKTWLSCHNTCPTCRRNADEKKPEKVTRAEFMAAQIKITLYQNPCVDILSCVGSISARWPYSPEYSVWKRSNC